VASRSSVGRRHRYDIMEGARDLPPQRAAHGAGSHAASAEEGQAMYSPRHMI